MKLLRKIAIYTVITFGFLLYQSSSYANDSKKDMYERQEQFIELSDNQVNLYAKNIYFSNRSGLQYPSSSVGSGVSGVLAAYWGRIGEIHALNCRIGGYYSTVAYQRFCIPHTTTNAPNTTTNITSTTHTAAPQSDEAFTQTIQQAIDTATLAPAGLHIQPNQFILTNTPTLAYTTHPTQTLTLTTLNQPTTITLTATHYTYNWGDNTPPTHTTTPGTPWPNKTIQHTYTHPNPHTTITLHTTWQATTTNPHTGHTITIPNTAHTTETTPPTPTKHTHTNTTNHTH